MNIKPGIRLRSAMSPAELVVVRADTVDLELQCGGLPMLPLGQDPPTDAAADDVGELELGKRYASDSLGVEVLITKPGKGALTISDERLERKDAKALPASD